jgi:hypothetical protein
VTECRESIESNRRIGQPPPPPFPKTDPANHPTCTQPQPQPQPHNRLPGIPTPSAAKPKATLLWIVPPFLRHLPLLRGGSTSTSTSTRPTRLRARAPGAGAAAAAAARRRLAAMPSSASFSDAAAAPAVPSPYYSYAYQQQESGAVPMGTLEGGAAGQGGAEIHGPEADAVPIVIKCE